MAQIDDDDLAELQEAILLLEEWRRKPDDSNWPQRRTWNLEPFKCEIRWAAHGAAHTATATANLSHSLGKAIMSLLKRFKAHKHAE